MGKNRGFTLIELIVVVLIIGIIASFAVPSYLKSVENSKADDAVAMLNMASTTNRMYALDHNGAWAQGSFPASGACGSGSCAGTGGSGSQCDLVRCAYLADQDFGSKPYQLSVGNGTTSTACGSCNSVPFTACVTRKSGNSPGTNISPYTSYAYWADGNGVVTNCGGAPIPVK